MFSHPCNNVVFSIMHTHRLTNKTTYYCSSLRRAYDMILKRQYTQKWNSVIIYSSSSRSKPVWMCLLCWTQRKIFWRMRETEQVWITTMEVNGAPEQPDYNFSSEYLPLCSEQTHSYRFGTTWGRVNDDRIFIFWVYCPFKSLDLWTHSCEGGYM